MVNESSIDRLALHFRAFYIYECRGIYDPFFLSLWRTLSSSYWIWPQCWIWPFSLFSKSICWDSWFFWLIRAALGVCNGLHKKRNFHQRGSMQCNFKINGSSSLVIYLWSCNAYLPIQSFRVKITARVVSSTTGRIFGSVESCEYWHEYSWLVEPNQLACFFPFIWSCSSTCRFYTWINQRHFDEMFGKPAERTSFLMSFLR